jgi:hypothetical protein
MQIVWSFFGKPLAALGGRSFEEMRGLGSAACDKSAAVGLMCLISTGVIFAGHTLFWRNFDHVASGALWVASGIALLFAAMYRVALRSMETMSGFAKAAMLALLALLMGVNALLAGHELVLLAFEPQVEAQARLGAARGVTAYVGAVEASLGLPALRDQGSSLDKGLATALAERKRLPEGVLQLQQQAQSCEIAAQRLHAAAMVYSEHPSHPAALTAWRQQRSHCVQLGREAQALLARHRQEADAEVTRQQQAREKLREAFAQADAQHQTIVKRDRPTLVASATTGFARHDALWAAVAAGTVPAWAAYGLMAAVLVIDAFSFLVKLLAHDDAATTDRVQAVATDAVYDNLHAALVRQQHQLTRQAVQGLQQQTQQDLANLVRQVIVPSVEQGLEERAFSRTAAALHRVQSRCRSAPPASMLARLGGLGQLVRRRARSPSAATT